MGGGRLEFAAQPGLFREVSGQHREGVAFLVAQILEHVMVALGKFQVLGNGGDAAEVPLEWSMGWLVGCQSMMSDVVGDEADHAQCH